MSSLDGRDSLAELHQIDAICDRFEWSFNAGAVPRIEDFVVELPERSRPLLLKHLIQTEIALRQRASDPPLIADYLHRFPNDRDIVEGVWSSPSVGNLVTVSGSVESTEESLQAGAAAPQNAPPEPMPAALGRFQILHQIDRGSFGTIFLAFDPTFSRQVAIKLPHTNVLNTPRLRTRIIREAQALGQINDPRVCPVYEIGDPEGQCYLVMPYLSGESLDAYRKRHERLDARAAAEIIREVALALQRVHQAGIVHRDLTPRNIQITAERTPIILDFGLARPLVTRDATVTGSGEVLGTPAYMAPEQAVGDSARIGPAVDIYSLGVILFELLSGVRPFQELIVWRLLAQVERDPAPLLSQSVPDPPRVLEEICRRCLEKNPADRPATMADLARMLSQFLDDLPVLSAQPDLVEQDTRRPETRFSNAEQHDSADPVASTLVQNPSSRPIETLQTVSLSQSPVGPAPARHPRASWLIVAILVVGVAISVAWYSTRKPNAPGKADLVVRENPASKVAAPSEPPIATSTNSLAFVASPPLQSSSSPAAPVNSAAMTKPAPVVKKDVVPDERTASTEPNSDLILDVDELLVSQEAPDVSVLTKVWENKYTLPLELKSEYPDQYERIQANGVYSLRTTGPTTWGWPEGPPWIAVNYVCELTAKIEGGPTDGWGLSLGRNINDGPRAFRGICISINGNGSTQVDNSPFDGGPRPGISLPPLVHEAIKTNGETNRLMVIVRGRRVEVYVNDVRVRQPFFVDRDIVPDTVCVPSIYAREGPAKVTFDEVTIRAGQFLPPRMLLREVKAPDLSQVPIVWQNRENDNGTWPNQTTDQYSRRVVNGLFTMGVTSENGNWGWEVGPYNESDNFAAEIVGSMTGGPHDCWGITLDKTLTEKKRGLRILLTKFSGFSVLPSLFETERTRWMGFGPISNPLIHSEGAKNTLLVILRQRQMELYVNGFALCEPFLLDRPLTPAAMMTLSHSGIKDSVANFERVRIYDGDRLPPSNFAKDRSEN